MKFLSGCFGKVLLVLFCILLGVVMTLGGIAGVGYYVLMTDGMMGKLEEKANETGAVTLDFSDEVKQMSVLTWLKGMLDMASNLTAENGTTIGELEKYIGMDVISSSLADILQIDPEVIQGASLVGEENGLGHTITATLTMNNIVAIVGDIMPDMPIFDPAGEFMNTPISTAFTSLTEFKIGDFITVTEDSAQVMKALADIKISEIGETLPTLPIGDFIDQGEDTHPVITAISPLSINDLGTSKLTETINNMKLSDILTDMNEETTNKVLYSLKDLTVGDLSGEEASNLINSMFLGEIMDIDTSSNQALQTLQFACIASQYTELTSPSFNGDYAYVVGPNYVYLGQYNNSESDYGYYVAYYPDKTKYDCAVDSAGVPIQRNGKYGVNYRIYRPASSLTDGKITVNGIEFSAVLDDEGEPITNGDKTQVEAVLYVDSLADFSASDKTVTVKNRYHCLYDEEGNFVFHDHFDEAYKSVLRIPSQCVRSADSTHHVLSTFSEHKIIEDKYLDNKAILADGKVRIDGVDYSLYEFHPLEGINEKMNDITLGGVMEIDESSPRIMQSLKDTKIDEMGDKVNTLPLGDLIDPGDSRILKSLADTPVENMSEKINTLFIDEIMTVDESSSQMIKALRYATLENSTEAFDLAHDDTIFQSGTEAFLTATNATEIAEKEVPYYSNYVSGETTSNRYYYKKVGNAIDKEQAYVVCLDENDVVKTDELGKTLFYKIKYYDEVRTAFIDTGAYLTKTGVDYEKNAEIIDAEEEGKNYYYSVDGAGYIDRIYVQSGAAITDGLGNVQVSYVIDAARPMIGLSDKTNELVLSDVMEINDSSSKILKNLADAKVNKLGSRIDTMTLGEMVDTDNSKLLTALSDSTLDGVDDTVNTLFIDEIMTIDEGSSQMIKSLRYASLESQIEKIIKSSADFYTTATLPLSVTNRAEYIGLEVPDYNGRYYYQVEENAIQNAYVLYLDSHDLEKTEDGKTFFYKTKRYEPKTYSYIETATLTPSEDVDAGIGENATVLARQEEGKTYYYLLNGSNEIETIYVAVLDDNDQLKTNPANENEGYFYTVTERFNRPMVGLSDKTDELLLSDVIEINDSSSKILKNLKDSKVTDLGSSIDDMTLGEMVDTDGSKLLTALSDSKLDELGGKVNTLFIDEIMTIDEGSSQMIKSLRYATLESQIVRKDKSSLTISSALSSHVPPIANAAEYQDREADSYKGRYYYEITGEEITDVFVVYLDKDDNEDLNVDGTAFYKVKRYEPKAYSYIETATLTPSENVDAGIGENAAVLAKQEAGKTYYYLLNGSGEIETIYVAVLDDHEQLKTNPMNASEGYFYTVTESYYRPMIGLSDKTNELTIGDVFSDENLNSGVLSLIDKGTKLNSISTAVASAVQNSSVAVLADTGVISDTTFTGADFAKLSKERRSFIYNSTMTDMLNGMIGFMSAPLTGEGKLNYTQVSPHITLIADNTAFTSLTDFVASYSQYDEVVFGQNVTITVDTSADGQWAVKDETETLLYYAIPMFNIGTGSYKPTITSVESVYIAIYATDGVSYTGLSQHQVGYFYDLTDSMEAQPVTAPATQKVIEQYDAVLSADYTSLTSFVQSYVQYGEVLFENDVTVTVNPGVDDLRFGRDVNSDLTIDYYVIPIFNITGTHTVTFDTNVYIAVFDMVGTVATTYSGSQEGVYYDPMGSLTVEPGTVDIVNIYTAP